jgi:hypothetical protein
MPVRPTFSLLVPTRRRSEQLGRLLDSLACTAVDPGAIEVVLVIDADDRNSLSFRHDTLLVKRVVVQPGLPMGALNMAAYKASTGAYLMLLNDDVVARTRRWDRKILACLRNFPDGIVLIHTNDRLFQEMLCTFPLVSRTFCELAGGICPSSYLRYRIDDHIEDVFNLLGVLDERRTVYLPEVVFEHRHSDARDWPGYTPNPTILALDAPRFEALLPARKQLALRLKEIIVGGATPARRRLWQARLAGVMDSIALRVPDRLRVVSEGRKLRTRLAALCRCAWACARRRDWRGAGQVVWERLHHRINAQHVLLATAACRGVEAVVSAGRVISGTSRRPLSRSRSSR